MYARSLLLVGLLCAPASATALEDYLPDGVTYDPGIPKPAATLGFEVGEWHVRHDQLVEYLQVLAEASDRIRIEVTGRTHEQRPLLLLTVSSPANLGRLDQIQSRIQNDEAEDRPLVVWQGFSVHGNEASGSNAALPFVYYLAAAQGAEIDALLDDTIILIDPALNPDGLGRFAQWANSYRATTPNPDPHHRVHHEVWPNGRTNHYWFDLNRDWILLVQPETRARVAQFHRWRPHVLTDFHEMWSNATFFFQPGVPSRLNPLTPERNQQLTRSIGQYHAAALDRLGQLYYTEETFDDFYYGKGSTYPDINGAIGILFEQASSRGQLVDTIHGELAFPATVRNQLTTALSTLRAAHDLRDELRDYRRDFYARAREQARQDAVKAWVIGDDGDPARAYHLIDLLRQHQIEVHELAAPLPIGSGQFEPGSAWVVPTDQRQYLLLKSLMEQRTTFEDTVFYDVSTWTLPLSFNLPYTAIGEARGKKALGARIDSPPRVQGRLGLSQNPYAYVFEWTGYYAPRALQRLLAKELRVYAATKPFTADTGSGEIQFGRGTIVVPVGTQGDKRELLEPVLRAIAENDGIDVHVVDTGLSVEGIDLGSPSLRRLEPVKPLLVVGSGVSGYEAGEVWHLLDTRVGLPLSMTDIRRLEGIDLRDYTDLILVHGKYDDISAKSTERIRTWVQDGGHLLALKNGAKWVTEKELHVKQKDKDKDQDQEEQEKTPEERTDPDEEDEEDAAEGEDQATEKDAGLYRPYGEFRDDRSRLLISGAIFEIILDNTHPVGYGYNDTRLAVFRNGTYFMQPGTNPYETVGRYTDQPLLSGYVGEKRMQEIRGSAAIVASRVDQGAVIRLADNPNFRGIWYGTNRLFLNALYFAQIIDPTKLPD